MRVAVVVKVKDKIGFNCREGGLLFQCVLFRVFDAY